MKPYNGVDINIEQVTFWEMEFLGEKYHVKALPNETRQEFVDRFFNKPIMAPVVLDNVTTDSMHYLTQEENKAYIDNLYMMGTPTGYNIFDGYSVKKGNIK